jgi:hypothetical protein
MIRDCRRLKEWEIEYQRQERPDFFRNLQLYEALYSEARSLGLFPLRDPLEGLQVKIRMAKVLNVSTTA